MRDIATVRRPTGEGIGVRLAVLIGAVAVLCLLVLASKASATYQQLPGGEGIFAGVLGSPPPEFPEEVQLGGVSGMAVNRTGNGGVPAGTVYAAAATEEGGSWVAMYEPKAGPGKRLEFVNAWQLFPASSYTRCGKLAIEKAEGTTCEPRVKAQARAVDVDVDQTTGNVYAFNGEVSIAGNPMIAIYNATGSAEIGQRFGKKAPAGKKTSETPSEIHESPYPGGIAVGPGGTVYVFDANIVDNSYHRLMTFKPKTPGVFTEYEYVVGGDFAAGFLGQGSLPAMPVADAAGHIYTAVPGGNLIEEYDPSTPAAAPICKFEFSQGGIVSLTVDPVKEEPYFFSTKKVGGLKKVHHLSKCSGGKFTEVETIELEPERDDLYGLAFDPLREVSPTRPPGVLYGGAPGPEPTVGKGEPGQSSLGYTFARTEESPPSVETEPVSAVTASSAQLHATINPEGFKTRYAFEYLTEEAWEANPVGEKFNGALEAPPGGAPLGEGGLAIAAAETISGLAPDTVYHYRAIATNCAEGVEEEACEAQGADQSFRTLAPQAPAGRAYELVSPPQKNGGQALPADTRTGLGSCGRAECKPGNGYTRFPMVSSPDGNRVAYEGTPFFPDSGAAVENQYLAPRDPQSGWATQNLTPALLVSKNGGGYKTFTPSLQTALLQQTRAALTASAPLEFSNLYLEQNTNPFTLAALLSEAPPNRQPGQGPEELLLTYAGASQDLSKVFFTANDALTFETPLAPAAEGGIAGKVNLYEWSAAGLRLVNVAPANTATFPDSEFGGQGIVSHAISADGSHAFFSDEAGQLYVRINAERTQEIDDPGNFLTASADGSKVLLDDGCLYGLADEECEDLTKDEADVPQGGFLGLSGQSEDLSHVYFVDSAALTTVPNEAGDTPQATKPNLYSWEEAETGGQTSFVGTLAAIDNSSWQLSPSSRTAEASPSGRFHAFISRVSLTDYDNLGPCEHTGGVTLTIPCAEAFLFDSQSGKLYCASCNPSEAAPLGFTVLRQLEGANSAMAQPRYLTDSGRLYFDTQDSLSAADSNEGAEDVYEFAPPGTEGCQREAGCPELISGGRENGDSNLVAIDPSGQNVFFTTRDHLVAADSDELIDLYDAREGGGIPSDSTPRPLPCQGEACQPPSPPSPDPPLGSQTPTEGNQKKKPPKCKKGQVRKNGKCVKKGKGKKHKAKKASRGGAR
jgi:hypothetical protein